MIQTGAGVRCPGFRRVLATVACAIALVGGAVLEGDAQEPLSLEEAISIALANNPSLAGAEANLDAAKGSRLSSYSGVLPRVSASVDRSHNTTGAASDSSVYFFGGIRVALPPTPRRTDENYSARASLSQNLVNLPSIFQLRASHTDVASSRESLRASRAALVQEVRSQYFLLLRAIMLSEVATDALAVSAEQLRRSETLLELGSVARSDVLQARVNRANAERDEIALRNSVEQQRARLAVLLGREAGEPLEIQRDVADPAEETLDEDALVAEAISDLPEVRRARAEARGAGLLRDSAFWSQFPTLGFSAFYSKQEDGLREVLEIKEENAVWGYAIGLNWDVFDGLATIGGIQRAKAAQVAAREEVRRQELAASLAVREAVVAIRNAREEIRSTGEGVALADENLRLQQALYENGAGTILELNNAQVERTRARAALVTARIALQIAMAQLDRARGR